ncbi:hypothetical protein EDB80DRAFT_868556 [Ilyonectria destructans]|nr:hypothetical protein EDB80DRAFT_868556 [Ilyonectria destructans]
MAPYNAQWEAQIEVYRKNRRLLVARNIDFKATRAAFEADVRARLTKPDSVIFLWPPPSSAQYTNQNRHRGWDYVFRDRPIRIDRASRVAHAPGASRAHADASTTAAAATTAPTTATPAIAPAIVAPTTTAPTTAPPTAPATAARNLPAQPTPAHGTAAHNSPDSLEGALLVSWESLPLKRDDVPEDEDDNQSNRDIDDEVFWDD